MVGASFFCEGANDIQLGIAGYSEEEVPSTDGMIGLTGQRMELMEGCVTAAMLVLTGAELVPTVAGMLGYGTYLLNEQISKLPPFSLSIARGLTFWPSVTDGITGMSGGAATTGKVLDFVHVPAIPNIFTQAIPSLALIGNAQVAGILDEGIAKMTGGGDGGLEQIRALSKSKQKHILNRHCFDKVKDEIEYLLGKMPRTELDDLLTERSFFNKNWNQDEIITNVEDAYDALIKNGVKEGENIVYYAGEKIIIFIEQGNFKSAWGDYIYNLSDFGY